MHNQNKLIITNITLKVLKSHDYNNFEVTSTLSKGGDGIEYNEIKRAFENLHLLVQEQIKDHDLLNDIQTYNHWLHENKPKVLSAYRKLSKLETLSKEAEEFMDAYDGFEFKILHLADVKNGASTEVPLIFQRMYLINELSD